MRLRDRLKRSDPDLFHSLMYIRGSIKPVLEQPVLVYFTDHSVKHSEHIIRKLDALTEGIMASSNPLSATEIYILLVATYVHDIGMQDEQSVGGDLTQLREKHHELAGNLVRESINQPEKAISLNIADEPDIVNAVALVAQGHRQIDIEHDPEYEDFVLGDEPIRIKLLTALLRLGDELDLDYSRVEMDQAKLKNVPARSLLHWYKCHYVSGVSIQDGYITVHYRFPDQEQYEHYGQIICRLVQSKLEKALAELKSVFQRYGVQISIADERVRRIPTVKPMPHDVENLADNEYQRWCTSEMAKLKEMSNVRLTYHESPDASVSALGSPYGETS